MLANSIAVIRRLVAGAAIIAVTSTAVGCSAAMTAPAAESAKRGVADCIPLGPDHPAPAEGVLFGVNLDWGALSVDEYAARIRLQPAVVVAFSDFPLTHEDRGDIESAVSQLQPLGAVLMLTLEPFEGITAIGDDDIEELVTVLEDSNDRGVPVIVRFAHEMNGSWYAWGQQPTLYTETYRRVAEAVHENAPDSTMMWAPNYGGGYPFSGGEFEVAPGTADFALLDTDESGSLTGADDPYAPYYPGDDAVDWVGMSLYHWGSSYPWGENELPEEGKFVAQLTGTYNGLGGDDSALPDFYGDYAVGHGKPLGIPETAALVHPLGDDVGELAVKQAWWRQVFADDVHERFPELRLISWFEWDKTEVEVNGRVDWTVTASRDTRRAFTADLPAWLVSADRLPGHC